MRALLTSCLILTAAPAHADELSERVCPILEKVAAASSGKAAFAVQADLVMSVGGAFDFDPEALRTVLDQVDASTAENCPEVRSAVLKLVEMQTLYEAMR